MSVVRRCVAIGPIISARHLAAPGSQHAGNSAVGLRHGLPPACDNPLSSHQARAGSDDIKARAKARSAPRLATQWGPLQRPTHAPAAGHLHTRTP